MRATTADQTIRAFREGVHRTLGPRNDTFVRAGLTIDVLMRLRSNRTFFRVPGPYKGRRASPKHGPVLKLGDPTTHGTPDRTMTGDDPVHGSAQVDVWEQVHGTAAADAPFTLVRV